MNQSVKQIISAASAAVDQSSSPIDARNLLYISVQAVITGTSTGTLKLQFSNDILDPTLTLSAPTNWSDIPNATVVVAGAGVVAIPKTDLCYQTIRAVFIHTNGASGTITVNTKVIGA